MTNHRIQTPQAKRLGEQGLVHATAHALSGLARKVDAEQAGISVYKLDYWRTLATHRASLLWCRRFTVGRLQVCVCTKRRNNSNRNALDSNSVRYCFEMAAQPF